MAQAGWKAVEQFGKAPKLELAFERDGKVLAYLLPSDPHSQECFDAMKEIKRIFNLGLAADPKSRRGRREDGTKHVD